MQTLIDYYLRVDRDCICVKICIARYGNFLKPFQVSLLIMIFSLMMIHKY